MNVDQAIQTKRAVRTFSNQPLTDDDVHWILHAGRRAQSAKNTQPWHFIAIRERERLKALSRLGTYAEHLAGAALGIVLLTPDPVIRWSIMFDAGQAAAYMQLAAWERGIGSCPATIYELEAARELLSFSPDLHAHVALSFGYPQDPGSLTKPPQRGGRKPFGETIHFETWGSSP